MLLLLASARRGRSGQASRGTSAGGEARDAESHGETPTALSVPSFARAREGPEGGLRRRRRRHARNSPTAPLTGIHSSGFCAFKGILQGPRERVLLSAHYSWQPESRWTE